MPRYELSQSEKLFSWDKESHHEDKCLRKVFWNLIWVVLAVFEFSVSSWVRAESVLSWKKESFSFALADGTQLNAQVQRPVLDVASGNHALPLVLIFGGFQDAAKVLSFFKTADPAVFATFDYPFVAERRFHFPQSLFLVSDAKRTVHQTLEGILLFRKILVDRGGVDPRRCSIIGASMGAPFALVSGARDPGFSGVVLIHGFGNAPEVITHQLNRSWIPKVGGWIRPLTWMMGQSAGLYLGLGALEDYALQFQEQQKILMISAERDSFVPRETSDSLWEALQKSKAQVERVMMSGDHVQPGAQDLVDELVKNSTQWMKKNQLL